MESGETAPREYRGTGTRHKYTYANIEVHTSIVLILLGTREGRRDRVGLAGIDQRGRRRVLAAFRAELATESAHALYYVVSAFLRADSAARADVSSGRATRLHTGGRW